jgi:hypothetical protein
MWHAEREIHQRGEETGGKMERYLCDGWESGLSKLALLLFRCTGHDDAWCAGLFGRMECTT